MDLKKLELDMLEQVFNIILTIPDTIIQSIPSIQSPLVLTQLKRIRQKIKNKLKIGKTRLTNECYSRPLNLNNNSYGTLENKSRTSVVNGFDSITNSHDSNYEKPTHNSTNYNQNNILNESNSITNTKKWVSPDFQTNNTQPMRLTSNRTDIYNRERLNVNELECIVNDDHFDSFSVSDVKVHNGSENYNGKPSIRTHLETKKSQFQNNFEKGNL